MKIIGSLQFLTLHLLKKSKIMAAGFLKYFLPKDKVFYSLFENAAENLELLARKFIQVVQDPDFNKLAVIIKEMEDLENTMLAERQVWSSINFLTYLLNN
jgi:hypothetical protein